VNSSQSCEVLFQALRSLRLPTQDYVIFGSGPLLAHGLREQIGDLDLVARRTAWVAVTALGCPVPAPSGVGRMVRLFDGQIDVFDRWVTEDWDVDALINTAGLIDGLPYASLSAVLAWKQASDRPKDTDDVAALLIHLKGGR